jgi:hypothetical protein
LIELVIFKQNKTENIHAGMLANMGADIIASTGVSVEGLGYLVEKTKIKDK